MIESYKTHPNWLSFKDIAVGFFKDDLGEIYVMIQNVNHSNGNWPIDNDHDVTLRVDFDFTQAPALLNRSILQRPIKESGAVENMSLIADGPDHSYLQITLAAGDPILLKYATGAPFALQ